MKRIKQWKLLTHTEHQYITTTWLGMLGVYETVWFRKKGGKIDWLKQGQVHSTTWRDATRNHCNAIKYAVAQENDNRDD